MNDDIDALRKTVIRVVVKSRLCVSNISPHDRADGPNAIDAYLLALVNQDLRKCPSDSDFHAQQRRAKSAEADWQEAVARLEELERKEAPEAVKQCGENVSQEEPREAPDDLETDRRASS